MPLLIAFEGIDGSGKTTLSQMFRQRLVENGVDAVWLCEPSDSPAGKKIRELATANTHMSLQDELNYFIEDRRWDVTVNILPALRAGRTVVIDRYFYSNACYQAAKGMDMQTILNVNRQFAPEADLIYFIDADVERSLARIHNGNRKPAPLFEQADYLQRVRKNYLEINLLLPQMIRIQGDGELGKIFTEIWNDFSVRSQPLSRS